MDNPFFERPILNSPYEYPNRHWELDDSGQPTQQIVKSRRRAEFITPIPKPKKRKGSPKQESLLFDEGKGLSILSGFVITLLLLSRKETYSGFIWRRFLRLFPAFFVCLLASTMLIEVARDAFTIAPPTRATPGRLVLPASAENNLGTHLVLHITMLHGLADRFVPHSSFAIIGQAWGISVEWRFYLLAPLAIAAVWRGNFRASALLCACLIVMTLVAGKRMGALPMHAGLFALGMGFAQLWRVLTETPQRSNVRQLRAPMLVACIVSMPVLATPAALVVWFAAAHVAFVRRFYPDDANAIENRFGALLLAPFSQRMGACSYSIYVCHMIVLYPTLFVLSVLDTGPVEQAVGLIAVVCIGSYALARILYRIVEQPFIALGRRWPPR